MSSSRHTRIAPHDSQVEAGSASDGAEDTFEQNEPGGWKSGILSVVAVLGVFYIHVLAFQAAEGWDVLDTVYFLVISMLTIGYGDVTPSTDAGMLLSVWFNWLCVFTVAVAVSMIQDALETAKKRGLNFTDSAVRFAANTAHSVSDLTKQTVERLGTLGRDSDVDGDADAVDEETILSQESEDLQDTVSSYQEQEASETMFRQSVRSTGKHFVSLVIIVFVGTINYHFREDWSWIYSLYFSTYTLTTVGYGDTPAPIKDSTKTFTIIFSLIGVLAVASAANAIMSTFKCYVKIKQLKKAISMSNQLIEEVDQNGDGEITRAEFLIAMLIKLQRLDELTLNHLDKIFQKMDDNGNGVLDVQDVLRNMEYDDVVLDDPDHEMSSIL